MTATKGHCLCRRVAFEFEGEPLWRGHCHCESCRRATSSPFTTFLGVPHKTFRWTGETPQTHRSSPGVRRLFCRHCGSPMAYESERFPGEIHLYAASLEAPADFRPDFHVHMAETLPWIELVDDLPRFERGSK